MRLSQGGDHSEIASPGFDFADDAITIVQLIDQCRPLDGETELAIVELLARVERGNPLVDSVEATEQRGGGQCHHDNEPPHLAELQTREPSPDFVGRPGGYAGFPTHVAGC